jgi:hypothetical protein
MKPMEDRKSAACKRRAASLLCVVTTCLLVLVTMEPAGTAASRNLNNPNQSCLDAGSSDVQRDCPVRTAQSIYPKCRTRGRATIQSRVL